MQKRDVKRPDCVLLYLQGNTGNPLHRIPVFTTLLHGGPSTFSPAILAPAPRSYWLSTNKTPTQRGILRDYATAFRFATERWPNTPITLYGHSLGGAIAVCLLASLSEDSNSAQLDATVDQALKGLILENPFSSIPDMVRALYPQRWLPYRFLAPLAWDKWDALRALQSAKSGSILERLSRKMLVMVSEKDEVVPREMGISLFTAMNPSPGTGVSEDSYLPRLVTVRDALHEDAWMQRQWASEVSKYLDFTRTDRST